MHNDAVDNCAHDVDRNNPTNAYALCSSPHQMTTDRPQHQKSDRHCFMVRTRLSHPSTNSAKFDHVFGSMASSDEKVKWIGY